MGRWHLLLVALALAGAIGAGSVHAQEGDAPFVWERYDVEIELQPNGTFDVSETQVLQVIGAVGRGFREIPLDRVEGITNISVEEPGRAYTRGSDRPYTYSATRQGEVARVDWWFPRTSQSKTFTLRYRVNGGIRVYEGGDQLYWTAVYADRPALVRSSTVTVRFPSDVTAENVRLEAYPERLGATAHLADPRTAIFQTTSLPAERPFEIRAQFPHGLVTATAPSWQAQADAADIFRENIRPVLNFVLLLTTLALAVFGGLALVGLWYGRGRDPGVGVVPATLSEPPGDLPAGVVGTLVDEQADVQDVVATLVDLANRGVLGMTEAHQPELVGSPRDYRLELLRTDLLGLRPYEKTVLATLFRGGERAIRLSDVKDRFVASIPLLQDQLYAEVERAGFFTKDPERVRRRYRSIGTTLLVVGLVGGALALFLVASYVELVPLPFVVLALLGLATRRAASAMPARTRAGALEAARWRAFGTFLRDEQRRDALDAERDRLEPWLPYAVALGVDKTWVRNLASVGSPPPRWYGAGPPGRRYPRRYRGAGMPPIIVAPSPWGWGDGHGDDRYPRREPGGVAAPESGGWGGPEIGGPQDWSDGLADMLDRTSDVLSRGGGGGWSGGGGGFGGGGGSGGGSGGFS